MNQIRIYLPECGIRLAAVLELQMAINNLILTNRGSLAERAPHPLAIINSKMIKSFSRHYIMSALLLWGFKSAIGSMCSLSFQGSIVHIRTSLLFHDKLKIKLDGTPRSL